MNVLLENWDTYMAGAKGAFYFAHFWKPRLRDFARRDDLDQPTGEHQ